MSYHYINGFSCFKCKFKRNLYSIEKHIRTCHPGYSNNTFVFEVIFMDNKKVNKKKSEIQKQWLPYESQIKFFETSGTVGDDYESEKDDDDDDERPLASILKPVVKKEDGEVEEYLEPFQSQDSRSLIFCTKQIYFLLLSFVQDTRSFSCQICGLFFLNSQDLKLHMVDKHKCIRYKMNACFSEEEFMFIGSYPEVFPTGTYLKNDYETGFEISFDLNLRKPKRLVLQSTRKKSMKCDLCDEKYRSLEDLVKHVKEDHKQNGFECRACHSLEPIEYLKGHTSTYHKENDEINFACSTIVPEPTADIFYIFFVNRLTVLRGNRQNTTCKVCSLFFADLKIFDHHMKFKHAVFAYNCHVCKESIYDITALDEHVAHNTNFFECYLMTTPANLPPVDSWEEDIHFHFVTGKIGDILKNSTYFNQKEAEDFGVVVKLKVSMKPTCYCQICGKNYNHSIKSVKIHNRSHGISITEKFQCVICKQNVLQDHFEQHCAAHKRKSILAFTYKVPSTRSWLIKYNLIGLKDFITLSPQEVELSKFICSLCPSFIGRTSNEFIKHVTGVHEAIEQFHCKSCNYYQYVSLIKLEEHAKEKHPSENSFYECEFFFFLLFYFIFIFLA